MKEHNRWLVYGITDIVFSLIGYFLVERTLGLAISLPLALLLLQTGYELSKKIDSILSELSKMGNSIMDELSTKIDLITRAYPEVLTDVTLALDRARAMQTDAELAIYAMWTVVQYDESLKEYFEKTLSSGIYTRRLIDIKTISSNDILDHLEKYWTLIWEGTYEVYFVDRISYEVIVVDHKDAAIFHYPARGFGCLLIKHGSPAFVTCVEGEFEILRENSTRLPAKELGRNFNRTEVEKWLEKTQKAKK